MKKKKLKLAYLMPFLLSANVALAEDVVQIKPFQAEKGVVLNDKKTFDIWMVNDNVDVRAFQCTFYLPEGMAVAKTKSGNCVSATMSDRFVDEEDEENYFSVTLRETDASKREYMVIANPSISNAYINGTSGVLLSIRYITDANMADGVYPIIVKDITMSLTDKSKYVAPDSYSYVTIGDNTSVSFDLSTLTGYVPSFVVEKLNEDMAADENLSIVDLSGATELGAELQTPEDVVSVVGTTGTLNREFTAKYWSSVCLPFAVSAEQVATLNAGGVEIERFAGYDASTGSLQFESVDAMEANTPYIVCSPTAQSPFTGLEGVTLSKGDMNHTVVGDMTFMGTFERQTISSDETATYYAFSATDGKFVRIGSNATVAPFRAYLKLAANSSSRLLNVVHNGGDATAIEQPQAAAPTGNGRRYTLQGIQQTTSSPAKGIVIENGLKRIVR